MSASKPRITMDDINRITLDYFFRDEKYVASCLYMLNAETHTDLFENFVKEAEKRGYSREKLFDLARKQQWKLMDLLQNRSSFTGGPIQSPFSYPIGMPNAK